MSKRRETIATGGVIVGIALGFAVVAPFSGQFWASRMQTGSLVNDAPVTAQMKAEDRLVLADIDVRYRIDPAERLAISSKLNQLLTADPAR